MIAIKHKYTNATLCEFDVETVKQAAEKGRAKLREADLYGADLREADLYEADLYGAKLREADLRGANLRGANLYGADLRGADLRGANLHEADLYGAKLHEADLHGADLHGANLHGADLHGANLRGANLDDEKLTKTPIVVVNLRYWCLISDGYMRLGCKRFTHTEWGSFSDEEIADMDCGALEFWKQWKALLLAVCKAHAPAQGE